MIRRTGEEMMKKADFKAAAAMSAAVLMLLSAAVPIHAEKEGSKETNAELRFSTYFCTL